MSTSLQDTAPLQIGLVSISDRASNGTYQDLGIPAMADWLDTALTSPWLGNSCVIPDDAETISRTLCHLADEIGCHLILTTGGTGPAPRDVTPEATRAVAERELPGFGEQMRAISLNFVPTAILSRQTAVIRGHTLIINLPGQPKSIREILEGVRDPETGTLRIPGIFAAVPYCLDLIGAPYIETNPDICPAFRPRSIAQPAPVAPPARTDDTDGLASLPTAEPSLPSPHSLVPAAGQLLMYADREDPMTSAQTPVDPVPLHAQDSSAPALLPDISTSPAPEPSPVLLLPEEAPAPPTPGATTMTGPAEQQPAATLPRVPPRLPAKPAAEPPVAENDEDDIFIPDQPIPDTDLPGLG